MHTTGAPAVLEAVKSELFYQNDTIIVLFFTVTKIKTMLKLLWPLLIVKLRNTGVFFGEEMHVLFKIRQLLSYPATLDEVRESCHGGCW